jgi:hypothetical protein
MIQPSKLLIRKYGKSFAKLKATNGHGGRYETPRIPNLGSRCKCVISTTSRSSLHHEKTQSNSDVTAKRKVLLPMLWLDRLVRSVLLYLKLRLRWLKNYLQGYWDNFIISQPESPAGVKTQTHDERNLVDKMSPTRLSLTYPPNSGVREVAVPVRRSSWRTSLTGTHGVYTSYWRCTRLSKDWGRWFKTGSRDMNTCLLSTALWK